MFTERDRYKGLRYLTLGIFVMLAASCKTSAPESFKLKTAMPANFRLNALASYAPATGETCTAKRRTPTRFPFKSELQEAAHTVEFDIPLAKIADSCPLVLKNIKLDIRGQYGPDREDGDSDFAWLSFLDSPADNTTDDPGLIDKLFNGQCQWLFRTMGPNRYLAKILRCRAEAENGQVLLRAAGGTFQRDRLARKIIDISFNIAREEEPYFEKSWLKTPLGWKACTGRWGSKNEEYCTTPPHFMEFKMPDGKACFIYPSCAE
ncbi:hypothetical protein QN382_20150 [Pseudomonas sp. 10B1]|uniref:hypothetical protein n=1 Tax=unclassified Pseudomonas TaxID=196821 RepID=UPI002AB52FA0|nr:MULTISPECIES: hypothetical protein [unclassified Pseudomonas]MDY7562610.1 hypothetical protein [Pseudomonas sp. AB6]MEA9979989.1 hypothetical protein [Pseudomonas sp. RTS4]MEA9997294.1 hypothetical protein [Pseudomonas sp. AA4]MEB0087418.1 hypothetical protein [Pseudomonas sp. RTI1]MEB0128482.1 hypothetical protein [Pseudomonas sp. CCC1.2]